MEQIDKYLAEMKVAMYKMSQTKRQHLMEVLHLAFADHFENDYRKPGGKYIIGYDASRKAYFALIEYRNPRTIYAHVNQISTQQHR